MSAIRSYCCAALLLFFPLSVGAEGFDGKHALVCDLESAYCLTDTEGMTTAYGLIQNVTTELHHIGAPFDVVFLSQLEKAAARYKMLVFLNTFHATDPQVALLETLRRAGRHAMLWLWTPGLVGPEGIDPVRASRVTGFKHGLVRTRMPILMSRSTGDRTLSVSGVQVSSTWPA